MCLIVLYFFRESMKQMVCLCSGIGVMALVNIFAHQQAWRSKAAYLKKTHLVDVLYLFTICSCIFDLSIFLLFYLFKLFYVFYILTPKFPFLQSQNVCYVGIRNRLRADEEISLIKVKIKTFREKKKKPEIFIDGCQGFKITTQLHCKVCCKVR